ncbi:hypothetical protein D3C80_1680090 [compost metagenome]
MLSVTSNPALYNGMGYGGCTGGKWDGCSTKDHLAIAVRFEPQWLQVFPGVDLSMPISDVYGIYGNPAQLSTGQQGSHNYSIGVKATIRQKATATLAFNGSYSHTSKIAHTPSGLPYYASGNSAFGLNDRNWVSLTLQTSF